MGVPSPQIFYFNRTAWDNSESEGWQSCVLCRQCSAELVWVCMLCFICVQVISAYREVVNNLYLDDVTEKWSAVLNQLEKFELEIGSGKYFGGEEIGISWTAECENYLCVEMCHCFLRANSFDICSRELCFQLFQFAANIVSHVSWIISLWNLCFLWLIVTEVATEYENFYLQSLLAHRTQHVIAVCKCDGCRILRLHRNGCCRLDMVIRFLRYVSRETDRHAHDSTLLCCQRVEWMMSVGWLAGAMPALVDMMVWPWFERFAALSEIDSRLGLSHERFPRICMWQSAMARLPAVKQCAIDTNSHAVFIRSCADHSPHYGYGLDWISLLRFLTRNAVYCPCC